MIINSKHTEHPIQTFGTQMKNHARKGAHIHQIHALFSKNTKNAHKELSQSDLKTLITTRNLWSDKLDAFNTRWKILSDQ